MKVCPNCKTEYSNDLEFCLADGTVLLDSKEITEAETISLPADKVSPTVTASGKNFKTETETVVKNTTQQGKKGSTSPMVNIKGDTTGAKTSNAKLYAILGIFALLVAVGGYFLYSQKGNLASGSNPGGELSQAYEKLYKAVKSKNPEQIKQIMSKNSIGLAEFAASQQKKTVEQVLENGFTATTFSETLPKMRDERIKDEFGAVEVWNEKSKVWEDLPFIKEDGVWKFAIGDMFKGSYQKPAIGQAIREQEEANKTNPNLIPQSPPMDANKVANTNANVNTVQVQPVKPALEKKNIQGGSQPGANKNGGGK